MSLARHYSDDRTWICGEERLTARECESKQRKGDLLDQRTYGLQNTKN